MNKIIVEHSIVNIGTNKFINVPIILQVDGDNIIEVERSPINLPIELDTKISVYHPDGTYLAKVVGSRLFPTMDGKRAGVKILHPDKRTVLMLGNKTLAEIRHESAAAISMEVELFTPKGYLVSCKNTQPVEYFDTQNIKLNGVTLSGNTFIDLRIGIKIIGKETFIGSRD